MNLKTVHRYSESALRVARTASVGDGDALESRPVAAAAAAAAAAAVVVVVGAEEALVVAVVQLGR